MAVNLTDKSVANWIYNVQKAAQYTGAITDSANKGGGTDVAFNEIKRTFESVYQEVSDDAILASEAGFYAVQTDFHTGGTGTITDIEVADVDTWMDVNFVLPDASCEFDQRPTAMTEANASAFDTSTGLFKLEGLTNEAFSTFRANLAFDPDEDEGQFDIRLLFQRHSGTGLTDFSIEDIAGTLNQGAEDVYVMNPSLTFFIDDTIDTNSAGDAGTCKFQVKSSVPGEVSMRGLSWFINI